MRILFTGDIMPGGVLPYQKNWISGEMQDYLRQFDLRVGTLECALGDDIPFDEEKMRGRMNIIYSPEKELNRVKAMGFNVVSLANNHAFDLGAEGLVNTIRLLDEAGIGHCGAGANLEEARKPAVVEIEGKTVAFLACCQYGSVYIGHLKRATATESGINPLDIENVLEDIHFAKQKYDYVFVMPHWGMEYHFEPTTQCRIWARQMIDAGADGVFASHTHQVQPLIHYHGKPIAFSMGNFIFPDYYMTPPRPIWYPEEREEVKDLPHFKFYPNHIDSPCVQEWKHISRIGVTAACELQDGRITADPFFSYLNADNVLTIYDKPGAIRLRMKWMGSIVAHGPYNLFLKIYWSRWNLVRRGYHFINRVILKN